ncbi:MAG: serine protease [Solirubrobacterales bacterium]
MTRFLAALAAFAAVAAGIAATSGTPVAGAKEQAAGPPATTSVVGGRAAAITEFPSLAFIAAKDGDEPFTCTGAVVAPRVVLTAGHCIEKPDEFAAQPPSIFRVVTGIADIRTATSANVSTVSEAIFYPTFETAKIQIDAGILILSAPVTAPPLAMASGADAALFKAGTPISIAGWGLTSHRAMSGSPVLQTAELALKPQGFCRRATRPFEPFYSAVGQICALNTPDYTMSGCFGDSGGPAIARRVDGTPVEVGIIVSGGPDCSRKLPNIYTRLPKISSWVAGWIASAETGAPPPPVPKASPPYLSFELAKDLGAEILGEAFRSRFRRGTDKRASCVRLSWDRVRCRVSWRLGAKRYRGTFAIDLEVDGYEVIPRSKVQVRSSGA